ncbi:MAG: hypothetical protein NC182_01620 [Prevotella sp.]|nr:hypothetical protein [Staphylococcus sp.]MCM1349881.1 hypothetical protein [Prevotella sp.]
MKEKFLKSIHTLLLIIVINIIMIIFIDILSNFESIKLLCTNINHYLFIILGITFIVLILKILKHLDKLLYDNWQ